MNRSRTVLAFLTMLVLTGFALSASAADKVFQLFATTYDSNSNSLSSTIPTGANVWLLLDFANQTPTSFNSVFKSIQLAVPGDVTYTIANVQTVNNGACSTTMPASMPPPGTTGGTLTLNNLQGVKPSGHLCIYMAVSTSSTTCTAVQWQGQANTGSNFGGGTAFTDLITGSTTSIANTTDGCTGVVGCTSGTTAGQYNNYASSLGSTNFTYDPDQTSGGPANGWGLRRGRNKDTTACSLIPFNFALGTLNLFNTSTSTNTIIPIATLKAPSGSATGQFASWKYMVVWPTQPIDASGWLTTHAIVSWGIANPTNDTDFIPALACLADPGDLTKRTLAELQALLPPIPDDSASNGPYSKAAAANPTVYVLGAPAKICVSQHGWSTGPAGKVTPWDEFVDEVDSVIGYR